MRHLLFLILVASILIAFPVLLFADEDDDSKEDSSTEQKQGQDEIPLHEVVVTETQVSSKDETADSAIVSGERLRDSARPSVLESLSQEASDVYVTGRGGGFHGVSNGASGAIAVRGLGGSPNTQILVVEDGVPDIQGIFGHPIPDSYVPFLIENVQVIRGGDSVLYGNNALGGVVVIQSRWRKEEGFELTNDSAYGSYNTLREQAGFLARIGSWDTAAAFTFLTSEGHRTGAGGNNAIGQIALRKRFTDNISLTVRDKLIQLEGEDPGPATHPNTDHWYDVMRNNASLEFALSHGIFSFNAIPYFNVGRHILYDGFRSIDISTGGKTEFDVILPASFLFMAGLAVDAVYGEVENRIEEETEPVEGNQSYSVYGQLSWQPIESLLFVGGVRELYSSEYEDVFLYKGGARWNFWGPLAIRSRVAKNFRQPTLRELYLPFPTANPDLKPETSLNADAGLELDSKYVAAEVNGYRTSAQNLIKYFGVWPSAEVVNIDHLTTYGIEERLVLQNLGPMRIAASGNYQDIGERYTRQNPREKYNFSVEANQPWGYHFFSGAISGEWVRGLFMNNYLRDAIPDVFFMDLNLRYRYRQARGVSIEPYLIIRNLLNSDYEYIEDYPMPKTNFLLGLRLTL